MAADDEANKAIIQEVNILVSFETAELQINAYS